MRPVVLFLVLIAMAPLCFGVGIGVSPPRLELVEGIGRITIFNPSDTFIRYVIDADEGFRARPSEGEIGPLKSVSPLIYGEGGGAIRVLAEPRDGGAGLALPAIEIPVEEEGGVVPQERSILIPVLCGALAALFIALASVCVVYVVTRRRASQPAKQAEVSVGIPRVHEERINEERLDA